MNRYFDDADFQFVKEQVVRLNNYLEGLEDEEDSAMSKDPRDIVSSIKGKVNSISRHWEDFEEKFSEKFSKHQIELLKEYGAEIHGDRAYWEQNRSRHEDIEGNELEYYTKEGDDPTDSDPYLQVRVLYVEDENDLDDDGEYHLEMTDELYDLEIEAARDDIRDIVALLYDLSSKFDFRKTLNMKRGQIDTDHVLQTAREIVDNPKSSNGTEMHKSDRISFE